MRGEPGTGSGAPRPIKDFLRPDEIVPAVEVPQLPPSGAQGVDDMAERAERIPEILRARDRWLSEVNLQRLPFAVLWDKKTGSKEPIVVEETYLRDGESVTRRWQVIPGSKFGLAGPSAYATFRALEKILLSRTVARGIPVEGPQEFEIQGILRELGLAIDDENYRRIKNDLRRIADAKFVDDGFLRERRAGPEHRGARARRRQTETRFSLIDVLVFRYEQEPGGRVARTNKIWFGKMYVDSVNSGYVKPLDWELWRSLERPVARRLYELIDLRLFAMPKAPVLEFDYDELAQLLPVKRQHQFAHARLALRGPLEALAKRVLAGFEWREDGSIWLLRAAPAEAYRRGLLARAMPEIDVRAQEVAQELRDVRSLPLYQRIVSAVARAHIDMALSETRMAVRTNPRGVEKPGAYFVAALRGILTRRALPVPFEQAKTVGKQ